MRLVFNSLSVVAFATAAATAFANVPGFVGCRVGDVASLPRTKNGFCQSRELSWVYGRGY